MTTLHAPVTRRVAGVVREDLVVTLYPSHLLGIRALRTRREYTLPLATIYRLAIEADLAARRAARRKGGRGAL